MRDYQKEWSNYKIKCVVCGGAWVIGSRYVVENTLSVEDCRPDNLRWLEYLIGEKEKNNEAQ